MIKLPPKGDTLHHSRKRRALGKYAAIMASVLVIAVLLKTFLVEPVGIDGTALEPGLRDGDRILVNKHIGGISRGDLILFGHPQKPSIRILERVVALPGETIQLREGVLYLDGKQIPEPYISQENNVKKSSTEEIEVPNGSYFVLGDNRDEAFDSREMGPIRRDLIYGKYWVKYWPL